MRKHKDTYSETGLHTIHLVNTPKRYRLVRNYLLVFLGIFIIILCLPWQQNVQGKGKLTPFSMADRPQTIPSILAGRIDKWFVQEGQFVKKGDTICVITEVKEKFFDPKLLSRTSNQIANKEDAVDAKKQKIINLQRQIEALKNSLKFKLEQSKNKVKQVRYKVAAEKAGYEAAQVNLKLAQDQYTRLEGLFNKGLASLTELQNRNNKTQEATAKMVEAENKYNSVQNELINAEIELNSVEADYIDKISKAESVVNETTGELLESRAEISKMQIGTTRV